MRNRAKDDAYRLLAERSLVQTERYLRQGRRFMGLTVGELAEQFVLAFRGVAEQPDRWPSEQVSDITAEFELRRIEPPYEQVAAETAIIEDHVKEWYRSASRERFDWISAALEAELAALAKRMN